MKDFSLAAVLPCLAQGFFRGRRNLGGSFDPPGEEELGDVFQASRALLYRLLFLFYGEARGLLPVALAAYRESSLRSLAEEIAAQAGDDPREAAGRLDAAYSATDRGLYQRLLRLFACIDRGDAALGIAKYGGTLFATAPGDANDRQSRTARFLLQHHVPDRHLARAVDQLARHAQAPAERLEFVDYRTREVRHLGVLHEKLAQSRLVVEHGVELRVVGDRAGRKANGTYYTPEAIVRQIVEQTLGPVLDRKLAALPAAASGVEGLLDFRVLDPAMGSGYFLLAAADFIAHRCCEVRGTGGEDIALIKRHVLQHCLYGVDLDPLAVELAKASLWLDAATPDMPPVLLDDHLRRGNALVGDTLEDLLPGSGRFDAIVGNPPYRGVRTGTIAADVADYITGHYQTARGNWDLAAVFLEKSLAVMRPVAACGLIVPSRLSSNRDFTALRELVFAAGGPATVLECGPAFEDPAVLASIVIVVRPPGSSMVCLGRVGGGGAETWQLPRAVLQSLPDRPLLSTLRAEEVPLFQSLQAAPCRLGEIAAITRGMECGKNDPNIHAGPQAGFLPVISGEAIRDFRIEPQGLFMRPGLMPCARYKRRELFETVPKLLVRFVASDPRAAVDREGYINCNTVYNIVLHDRWPGAYAALACLLNSHLIRWWFRKAFNSEESLFPHIQKYQLAQIPLPRFEACRPGLAELAGLGDAAAAGQAVAWQAIHRHCLDLFSLDQRVSALFSEAFPVTITKGTAECPLPEGGNRFSAWS